MKAFSTGSFSWQEVFFDDFSFLLSVQMLLFGLLSLKLDLVLLMRDLFLVPFDCTVLGIFSSSSTSFILFLFKGEFLTKLNLPHAFVDGLSFFSGDLFLKLYLVFQLVLLLLFLESSMSLVELLIFLPSDDHQISCWWTLNYSHYLFWTSELII